MVLIALAVLFVIAAAATWWGWRGDRRLDLCRCPRCSYEMVPTDASGAAAADLRCPECGRVAGSRRSLYHTRRRPRLVAAGIVGMVVIAGAAVWRASPAPWTRKLPRPVMLLILNVAATPPTAAGPGGLPRPTAAWQHSRSPWQRMMWQHQTARTLSAWADAVLAGGGPITDAELARLSPLAAEAHDAYTEMGGTSYVEAWVDDRLRERPVRERARARGDPDRLLRVEWVLAEMQFEGAGFEHRADYAVIPEGMIRQALSHSDPAVRLFGIERMGRRAHIRVMKPGSPLPPLRAVVEQLAARDPDAKVRERAAGLVAYMDGFLRR